MRPIDADALMPMMRYATIDNEIGVFPIKIGFDAIKKVIDEQPTIEPERKKGKWIGDKCSECGTERAWYGTQPKFCPDCGSYNGGDQP